MMKIKGILGMLWMLFPLFAFAQEKVVPIKYGDMDQWITRKIHESGMSIREVRLGGLRM